MKKRLRKLKVSCNLKVVESLHHGFLNFVTVSKDCQRASKTVSELIRNTIKETDNL